MSLESSLHFEPRLRFSTFAVGPTNRLAAVAARAVAGTPGMAYNPLFIYGGTGIGKTHLLGAIANLTREMHPQLRIRCLTIDEFVEQVHQAHTTNTLNQFRIPYQEAGMLLIDDLSRLAGHPEAEAELHKILIGFTRLEGQVVVTADCPPAFLKLDDRIKSRLSGGLVVDIAPPDLETRLSILRSWTKERQQKVDDSTLELAAQDDVADVRDLIGRLNREVARLTLTDQTVSDAPTLETDEGLSPVQNLLGDILELADHQIGNSSRIHLYNGMEEWRRKGYDTAMLDAKIKLADETGYLTPEDVTVLLDEFASLVEELQSLEAKLDSSRPIPASIKNIFRNPDRIADARRYLDAQDQAAALAAALPDRPPLQRTGDAFFMDKEKLILSWPFATGRIVEDYR